MLYIFRCLKQLFYDNKLFKKTFLAFQHYGNSYLFFLGFLTSQISQNLRTLPMQMSASAAGPFLSNRVPLTLGKDPLFPRWTSIVCYIC